MSPYDDRGRIAHYGRAFSSPLVQSCVFAVGSFPLFAEGSCAAGISGTQEGRRIRTRKTVSTVFLAILSPSFTDQAAFSPHLRVIGRLHAGLPTPSGEGSGAGHGKRPASSRDAETGHVRRHGIAGTRRPSSARSTPRILPPAVRTSSGSREN